MFNLESLRRVVTGSRYSPILDGLRFLAVVPVALWHLNSCAGRAFAANGGDLKKDLLAGRGAKKPTWDVIFIFSLISVMATETRISDYRRQTPGFMEFLRLLVLSGFTFSVFLGLYISHCSRWSCQCSVH